MTQRLMFFILSNTGVLFSGKSVEQKVHNRVFVGLGGSFCLSVMDCGIDDGGSSIACACANTDSS